MFFHIGTAESRFSVVLFSSSKILFTISKSKKNMQNYCKKLHLVLLIIISFLVTISEGQVPTRFCGKIQIQTPILSPLNQIIICKSEKLYFRTTIGLFPISSIDYTTKTLTISDSSPSSSSKHYVSPSLLTAGLSPTLHTNSLLLFNCSNKRNLTMPAFIRNCSGLHIHALSASKELDQASCLLLDDHDEKLDKGFHPKDLNCSHYRRVHRRSLEDREVVGLGTKVTFDIPAHVPDMCKECNKPNGNCGAGLRCICHVKECKDKVASLTGSLNPISNVLFSLLSSTAVIIFWIH